MVDSQLCNKCHGLFDGEWVHRAESDTGSGSDDAASEGSPGTEEEGELEGKFSINYILENPDWLHCAHTDNEPIAYRHHGFADVQQSAKSGCQLCRMLWDAADYSLRSSHQLPEPTAVSVAWVRPGQAQHGSEDKSLQLYVSYFIEGQDDDDEFVSQEVILELQYAKDVTMATNQFSANPSASMQPLVELIERWCLACEADEMHAECRPITSTAGRGHSDLWLPNRLIDTEPGAGKDYVRLVDSSQVRNKNNHVDYVTLSHCWGGMLPVRLLSSNLTGFQNGIAIKQLPKTFRDAIEFVRLLGIHYLWIDALCIIQDDAADWLKESLLMAHVYSHAVLNIAATFSRDGHGGLFKPDGTAPLSPCLVEAKWSSYKRGRWLCLDHSTFRRKVESGPLNQRTWVFQERMLAPRTVHFAEDQIWWECRKYRACETFPHGFPEELQAYGWTVDTVGNFSDPFQSIFMPVGDLLAQFHYGDDESAYQDWQWLVYRYTDTRVTKSFDRLIALVGITETVCTRMGWSEADYVAGWWRPDLARGLLWRAGSGQPSHTGLFPSWSWASYNGKVEYDRIVDLGNGSRTFPIEILDVDVATTGGPFGHVLHGIIRLRATLSPILLSEPNDTFSRAKRLTMATKDDIIDVQSFSAILDDRQAYHETEKGMPLYFCLIMRHNYARVNYDLVEHIGLILQRAEPSALGQYRRTGWANLSMSGRNPPTPSSRQCDHEISYLEDHGDGSFTFTIC